MGLTNKSKSIARLYSKVSPYPGRYIKLLSEKNIIAKGVYSLLARKYVFNQKMSRLCAKARFLHLCPPGEERLRILDVGCGTGEFTLQFGLAFPNAEVIGIDISSGSLYWAERLKRYFKIGNVSFIKKDFDEETLGDLGKFDLINCSGVLHHTKDPLGAIKNIASVMKDGAALWLVLYADFGMHYENSIRKGIRLIFPDDALLKDRADLAKELGFKRDFNFPINKNLKKIVKFKRALSKVKMNILTFGFHGYSDRLSDTDIFDAYANPTVAYYNAREIKKLAEEAELKLMHYAFYPPRSRRYEDSLKPYLRDKDLFSRMEICECFCYPDTYYLLLKK